MSKLEGGIFSNPSGKTAGIVFGAARTRQGKKVTARQLVPPSNPNTAAQQAQRGKFASVLDIVRFIGAVIYQSDFNRAISQLPGFQSMMSIYMNAMSDLKTLSVPPAINLGSLYPGAGLVATPGGVGELDVSFTDPDGGNSALTDELSGFAIALDQADRDTLIGEVLLNGSTREDSLLEFNNLTSGVEYLVGVYYRGSGVTLGSLSQVTWITGTAG